jgi:hypothetical protein
MQLNRPPRSKPSLPTQRLTAHLPNPKNLATAPNPSAPTNLDTAAETPLRSAGGSGSGVGRGLRPQRFPRNHHPPREARRMVGGRGRAGNGACRLVVAPAAAGEDPRGVPDGGQVARWPPRCRRRVGCCRWLLAAGSHRPRHQISLLVSWLPACFLANRAGDLGLGRRWGRVASTSSLRGRVLVLFSRKPRRRLLLPFLGHAVSVWSVKFSHPV